MTSRKPSIFVIINNPVDAKRLTFVQALQQNGHIVHICQKHNYDDIFSDLIAFNQKHRCDLILTFSWSFIHCGGRPFDIPLFRAFWQKVTTKTVVMWDDSPLRWSKIVAASHRICPSITHFVIDSTVVQRLRKDGINAEYFPIYYVNPQFMTSEAINFLPDVQILLCGNVADTEQFFQLLPGPADARYHAARKFLALKESDENYIDELSFLNDQPFDLNALDQPHFLAILTGIQRTVDRTRILQKIPSTLKVGLIGHNLSAKEIPTHVARYPGVSHASIGHIYALPIIQFGTSGWPAACNLRLFQAAAMGGIMFHEDRIDARRHFSPEADSFFYRDTDHLVALVEDAITHPEVFRTAAENAKQRFANEHTVTHRARQFVALVSHD